MINIYWFYYKYDTATPTISDLSVAPKARSMGIRVVINKFFDITGIYMETTDSISAVNFLLWRTMKHGVI